MNKIKVCKFIIINDDYYYYSFNEFKIVVRGGNKEVKLFLSTYYNTTHYTIIFDHLYWYNNINETILLFNKTNCAKLVIYGGNYVTDCD